MATLGGLETFSGMQRCDDRLRETDCDERLRETDCDELTIRK